MKKKTFGRIALCTIALCMASTCLLSGTLAKYTTEADGTGTIVVANFVDVTSIAGANSVASYDFTLASTKDDNTKVAAGVVAPGDKGHFDIVLGSSDVDYTYGLSITGLDESGVPIKFYTDETYSSAFSNLTDQPGDRAGKTITVYWTWDTASTDAADKTAELLNTAETDPTFTVTLTAEQTL